MPHNPQFELEHVDVDVTQSLALSDPAGLVPLEQCTIPRATVDDGVKSPPAQYEPAKHVSHDVEFAGKYFPAEQ